MTDQPHERDPLSQLQFDAYGRLVDLDEIAGNNFDLNIGRYLQSAATAEVDVEAALAAYRDAQEALRSSERILDAKLKAAGFDA